MASWPWPLAKFGNMRRIANNGGDTDSDIITTTATMTQHVEDADENHHLPPSILMLILKTINDSQLGQI
jgi:hypothetical protein